MANDPKTDLIYAILAMDSYNRGYGSGIKDLIVPDFDENGNPTNTVKVGNFSITRQSNTSSTSAAFAAGFYAIAYKKGTGASAETVIAYRGTDDNIGGDKTGVTGVTVTVHLTLRHSRALIKLTSPICSVQHCHKSL